MHGTSDRQDHANHDVRMCTAATRLRARGQPRVSRQSPLGAHARLLGRVLVHCVPRRQARAPNGLVVVGSVPAPWRARSGARDIRPRSPRACTRACRAPRARKPPGTRLARTLTRLLRQALVHVAESLLPLGLRACARARQRQAPGGPAGRGVRARRPAAREGREPLGPRRSTPRRAARARPGWQRRAAPRHGGRAGQRGNALAGEAPLARGRRGGRTSVTTEPRSVRRSPRGCGLRPGITQHTARSTRHAAHGTQHTARSTRHSAHSAHSTPPGSGLLPPSRCVLQADRYIRCLGGLRPGSYPCTVSSYNVRHERENKNKKKSPQRHPV